MKTQQSLQIKLLARSSRDTVNQPEAEGGNLLARPAAFPSITGKNSGALVSEFISGLGLGDATWVWYSFTSKLLIH